MGRACAHCSASLDLWHVVGVCCGDEMAPYKVEFHHQNTPDLLQLCSFTGVLHALSCLTL